MGIVGECWSRTSGAVLLPRPVAATVTNGHLAYVTVGAQALHLFSVLAAAFRHLATVTIVHGVVDNFQQSRRSLMRGPARKHFILGGIF